MLRRLSSSFYTPSSWNSDRAPGPSLVGTFQGSRRRTQRTVLKSDNEHEQNCPLRHQFFYPYSPARYPSPSSTTWHGTHRLPANNTPTDRESATAATRLPLPHFLIPASSTILVVLFSSESLLSREPWLSMPARTLSRPISWLISAMRCESCHTQVSKNPSPHQEEISLTASAVPSDPNSTSISSSVKRCQTY